MQSLQSGGTVDPPYGAEVFIIFKKLHAYMNDGATDKILIRAHLPWMADILIEKNLRRLIHVQRMGNDRLPRQLVYSQLCEEKRNQGRPWLRFRDVVKRNMKHSQINLKSWQIMAGT